MIRAERLEESEKERGFIPCECGNYAFVITLDALKRVRDRTVHVCDDCHLRVVLVDEVGNGL